MTSPILTEHVYPPIPERKSMKDDLARAKCLPSGGRVKMAQALFSRGIACAKCLMVRSQTRIRKSEFSKMVFASLTFS